MHRAALRVSCSAAEAYNSTAALAEALGTASLRSLNNPSPPSTGLRRGTRIAVAAGRRECQARTFSKSLTRRQDEGSKEVREGLAEQSNTRQRRGRNAIDAAESNASEVPAGSTEQSDGPVRSFNSSPRDVAAAAGEATEGVAHESNASGSVVRHVRTADPEQGAIKLPRRPTVDSGRSPPPWALPLPATIGYTGEKVLEAEIDRFAAHWKFSHAELEARKVVVYQMQSIINHVMGRKGSSVVYGSQRNGLAMPTSDIDLRVYALGSGWLEEQKAQMFKLSEAVKRSKSFICTVFRATQFAIVNTTHRDTGISVQVVAAPPTYFQFDWTRKSLQEIPFLAPVYSVLHVTLNMRGLIDVYNGGIGSYGLFTMLVACATRRGSPLPTSSTDLLLRFLDFYSTLDTHRHALTLTPPKLFKKHTLTPSDTKTFASAATRRGDPVRSGQWSIGRTDVRRPSLLCLQDPAKPKNDLGHKSFAINDILLNLRHLHDLVRRELELAASYRYRSSRRGSYSILQYLLGRSDEVHLLHRKKVDDFGRAILRRRAEQEAAAAQGKEADNDENKVEVDDAEKSDRTSSPPPPPTPSAAATAATGREVPESNAPS